MVADRYFRLFPTPPFQLGVPTDHHRSHWYYKTVPDPLEAYSSDAAMNWLNNSPPKDFCVKSGKPPSMLELPYTYARSISPGHTLP